MFHAHTSHVSTFRLHHNTTTATWGAFLVIFSPLQCLQVWTEINLLTYLNHPNNPNIVYLSLPVFSSSLQLTPPLPGQVSRGLESRTEYYLSFWLATARELFDCILTKDKFTKHDAITAPSLMPLITFTTMASSLRPRVHFLSSLSTLLPSSTWQTWEHPLPFQRLQPWRCHRWFWHASPHPFPTLDPPFLRAKLLHSPNDKIIFLSATHPPKSSKTPATKTPPTSGSWVWSLPHAYTNKTQTHFSLSLHIPIQTSRGITTSNQSSAKACALGATIIDASQWLTIDYESSLMQGLMTCTWGLMTDHYSAQKQ